MIDEGSPLSGHDAETLAASDCWLFLTIEEPDQVLATTVQDTKTTRWNISGSGCVSPMPSCWTKHGGPQRTRPASACWSPTSRAPDRGYTSIPGVRAIAAIRSARLTMPTSLASRTTGRRLIARAIISSAICGSVVASSIVIT